MKPSRLFTTPFALGLLATLAPSLSAQTNNYFGTTGTLSGSVWSTNAAGPYTSALNTTGGAIINFGNVATTITGGSITVAGINATANATISTIGGTISNFGNGVVPIDVASGVTLNFGSQAFTTSATAGYIKNGAGTLILAGAAWGGGFTLNAGTVAVGGVNAMGGAAGNTLTINGGTIRSSNTTARDLSNKYSGGITIGGNFTLGDSTNNGALTFNNNMALGAANRTITLNSAATFGGIISGSAGVGINKQGTGTLTLSGANTFSGATTFNAGTLVLDYATQNNSKLSDTASLTLGGTLTLAGATGSHTEVVASTTLTSGLASSITRTGANTAVIQLGSITVNQGSSLNFGTANIATTTNNNNSFGILGPWATISGDGWAVNSTNGANGSVAGAAYTDVTRLDSGTKTLASSLGHARIIEGTGTAGDITMAAPGTTSVNTLVNIATTAGTLDIGSGNTLATNALLQSGAGALTIGVPATPGSLTALTPGGDLALVANTTLTINSTVSDNTSASSLTKFGGNTLTLSGANDYSGATVINAGTLAITNANALGSTAGSTTVNGGGGSSTTGVILSLSPATTDLTLAENINLFGGASGRANLLNNSAQNHTLTGSLDVSSSTNLSQITSSGAGSITISGDITGTMSGGAVLFLRGDSTSALNRVIGSVNIVGGNLAKTDGGTWLVGAVGKTYSWAQTQVAVGTLKVGAAGVLPASSEIALGNTTGGSTPILDLNGFDQTVAGLVYNGFGVSTGTRSITSATPATLTVNNATDYLAVGSNVSTNYIILSGALGFVKEGAGTLRFSGANTHTGTTTVNGGVLSVNNNLVLQNSPLVTTGAGTLALETGITTPTIGGLSGATGDLATIFSAGYGNVTGLTLNPGTGTTVSYGGQIANGAANMTLTKTGAGTQILTQANTYTGATTISAGVLRITNGSALGSTSTATTQSGTSALELDGSGGDVIVGAKALSINGGGISNGGALRNIAGNNTYGGTVTMAAQSRINSDAGTLTLNNPTAAVTGAFNLVVGGAGNITIASPLTNGTGGVSKDGTGTLTLSAANTYSGATSINQGTLAFTTVNQSLAGGLNFGSTVSIATVGNLDLSAASATFAGAMVVQTNSASANTISIGSSQTLATNGNVTIGANAVGQTTNLTVSGAGSWTVTNAAAAGTFQVGGAIAASNSSAVVADLSALAVFNANLSGATSVFRVTDSNSFSTGSVTQTLKLAATSTITAATVGVGDISGGGGGAANAKVLSLGTGVNTINANNIRIGEASNQRGSGVISFQDSSLGSLIIRSQSGLTGTANLTMVNSSNNGTTQHDARLLLAGHTVDVSLNNIVMAAKSNSGVTGGADALITFDTGTFSANTTAMAARTGTIPSTTATSGTITIGGGTAGLGAVTMAVNTSTSATANPGAANATLNISGGAVTASSIMMAQAVNTGVNKTANANINLTGGTLTLSGDITRFGGTGTENATITVNGGTLDMAGFGIGTFASSAQITLAAQSGTLQNIGQINGGATALSKTSAGTLLLAGANTYSGGTTVNEGTLTAGNANALGSDNVTVAPGATLDLGGFAVTNTIINNGGTIIGAANYAPTVAQTLNGASSYSGTVGGDLNVASGGTLQGTATFTGQVTLGSGAIAKGTGSFSGGLVINAGATLAPGNSPGIISAGNTVWNGGSTYDLQMLDAAGSPGTGWDLLAITGTLDLTGASSSNKITVKLTSLSSILPDVLGNASGFDINTAQVWTIVTTTGGIIGATNGEPLSKFAVDITGFSNDPSQNLAWSIQRSGNALTLNYVPEPSAYAALAGLAALGLAWKRRRRA